MTDTWLEMGRHPLARKLLQQLGLRAPPQLLRSSRPWADDLLADKRILLNGDGLFNPKLRSQLEALKATVTMVGDTLSDSAESSEATVFQASLFDATHIQSVEGLAALYQFFRPQLRKIGFNHRILILIRSWPAEAAPEAHACARAIEGFARSLSKELGPKGAYVNALKIPQATDEATFDRLKPLVSYLLSDYSCFVTGQVLSLDLRGPAALPQPALAGSLAGKRALVTGAAQGIGYAIARRLAEEGAHVIALDQPQAAESLRELTRLIDGEGLAVDLSQASSLETIILKLQSAPSPLDIIVHNAGIARDRSLFAMSKEQWDAVLQINLDAVIRVTMGILQRGLLQKGGRIICMSSIVGIAGNYGQSNYSSAKAGLIGFVDGLSHHLVREGITANAVAPGFIETAMTANLPFMAKQFGRRLSSLGQGGTPDDVAELVAFLASPAAQGLNGSVVRICGGNVLGV